MAGSSGGTGRFIHAHSPRSQSGFLLSLQSSEQVLNQTHAKVEGKHQREAALNLGNAPRGDRLATQQTRWVQKTSAAVQGGGES